MRTEEEGGGGMGNVRRGDVWRGTCVTFKCLTTLKYTSLIFDVS